MSKVKTHIMIPEGILSDVDQVAGPRKRSRFIVEAIEEKLRHERFAAALRAGAGAWKEANHPDLKTQKGVNRYLTRQRSAVNRRIGKRLK